MPIELGANSNETMCECHLSGHRTLWSKLVLPHQRRSENCIAPVLLDVGAATLGIVATFSPGSLSAQQGYGRLDLLRGVLGASSFGRVRAVVVGKGAYCHAGGHVPLAGWLRDGRAHCIEGPNVGARESHTAWQFLAEFYEHLPRAVLFVQDDPMLGPIRELGTDKEWLSKLERSGSRRKVTSGVTSLGALAAPWSPTPCACSRIREAFTRETYGGYSPMHWWLRSFLSLYANGSAPLPSQIVWPATAQFVLPRTVLRCRTLAFMEANVRLSELAAPLKVNVPRHPTADDRTQAKIAKWANFGPTVVDFGAGPPRGAGYADVRGGINGMDFAQLYERSWFAAFDPALEEHRPAHPRCFGRAAIARSPMRCAGASCPYPHAGGADGGGCASTDERGETQPPPRWRYGPSEPEHDQRRCLASGCLTASAAGSRAWAAIGHAGRGVEAAGG